MKCVVLLLALTQFSGPALAVNGIPPQSAPVATQAERVDPKSGWTVIKSFPHVELVKEGEGTPDPTLTRLIADPTLREKVEAKAFKSLQVRNLAIRANPGEIEESANAFKVTYAASVKQSLGSTSWWVSRDQNTINIQGELTVEFDGKNVNVTVQRYSNSSGWENALQWLGYNKYVDLEFARAIAPPIIEHWFDEDPARAQALLSAIRERSLPKP